MWKYHILVCTVKATPSWFFSEALLTLLVIRPAVIALAYMIWAGEELIPESWGCCTTWCGWKARKGIVILLRYCLLYTSDAADDM
eukprot:9594412-Karenia_brevis.AAC.1